MAKDPNERYLTPKEVSDALASFLGRFRGELVKSSRGNRSSWVYFLAVLALIGFLWIGWRDFDPYLPQEVVRETIRSTLRRIIQLLVQYVVPMGLVAFLIAELVAKLRASRRSV